MKNEELFELLGDADENSVRDAKQLHARNKRPAWVKWAALAACLALAAAAVLPHLGSGSAGPMQGLTIPSGVKWISPVYAEPVAAKMSVQEFMESDAHWQWWQEYRQKVEASEPCQEEMGPYYAAIMEQLLPAEDENTVCSPLNLYLAFAMLAEVSDGNTRQQILDLLHAADIKTLRQRVGLLWDSNYVDTPMLKSLLANSVWLRDADLYNEETLQALADRYFASSFRGEPGSEAMDKALQAWTNAGTGGLLSDYTKDLKLSSDTVLALVSTLYYKATWIEEFYPGMTTQEIFHGTKGDVPVDMMHKTDTLGVYRTDAFTALGLNLNDSGAMYFFLPQEGVDVNALAADPNVLETLASNRNRIDEGWSFPLVHLSVPKFSVSQKTDLLDAMAELGLTDALDPQASDFSPLTEQIKDLYVSSAEHAAIVEIDENGVTGAAYTEMAISEGAAEPEDETDFILDRPFLFAITGRDGSILFAGVVRNIE